MDYPKFRELIIDEWGAGQRLDVFLSRRFSKFSRSSIARFVSSNHVSSPMRNLKPSSLLSFGDVLHIYIPGLAPSGPPPPHPPILFEDSDILVVNKPSGMLVHPSGDEFVWTIISVLRLYRKEQCLDLVHRLDRDTSGTLVITKNKESNAYLKKELQKRNINKVYHAISRGSPPWEVKDLRAPIAEHPTAKLRLRRTVLPSGLPSHTSFRVLQRLDNYSLIECLLHTGRTHQIRVHLEYLGYPILGDKIYGQKDDIFLEHLHQGATKRVREIVSFSRHCLHAAKITFNHPKKGLLTIGSPLPEDMQSILNGVQPTW